ncbi:hypothetical protein DFH11DRAFT_1688241 [Phellopilus nigrolimitatus]|nr:hypothetical protein DFH11DRAFT_1688241 [Phellopilus nigrolimitatus]
MSTLNSAIFDDASDDDEENDPDFFPENQSESEDERERGVAAPAADPEDSADREAARTAQESARAALWASFQTAVASPGTRSPTASAQGPRLVTVEKKYRFAGALVTEIVEVPEDSEDAKKWPLLRSPAPAPQEAGAAAPEPAPPPTARSPRDASASATVESPAGPSTVRVPAAPPSSDTPPLGGQARPRPGPRRPKTALAAPPAQGKPRKLSTLEKSAMDWRAHVAGAGAGPAEAEGLADELERNRRGGGFLEKVAFLERVGERREELFEGGRKRRRKG